MKAAKYYEVVNQDTVVARYRNRADADKRLKSLVEEFDKVSDGSQRDDKIRAGMYVDEVDCV